jgi:regulator of cell morphogenesis and NO signaling
MNETTITIETTIGEIVRARPASSRIFENLGIDYCCGGKRPLVQACQAKGLDAPTVLTMLLAINQPASGVQLNPNAMTLTELCTHIQQVHHAYLREELPRLDLMTRKVLAVHGAHEPRLRELRSSFETFHATMTAHTDEEDERVFPAIRQLEAGADAEERLALADALEKLEREHDSAGAALEQFKALTDSYTPPDWACNTFRALYAALAHLEQDMHQHVSKENSVLFPKALAAAAALRDAGCETRGGH